MFVLLPHFTQKWLKFRMDLLCPPVCHIKWERVVRVRVWFCFVVWNVHKYMHTFTRTHTHTSSHINPFGMRFAVLGQNAHFAGSTTMFHELKWAKSDSNSPKPLSLRTALNGNELIYIFLFFFVAAFSLYDFVVVFASLLNCCIISATTGSLGSHQIWR